LEREKHENGRKARKGLAARIAIRSLSAARLLFSSYLIFKLLVNTAPFCIFLHGKQE